MSAAGVIYVIRSAATGRVYVGSTVRAPRQRWLEHLHYLRKGTHHTPHLQRVFNKYCESDLSTGRARKVIARECKRGEA